MKRVMAKIIQINTDTWRLEDDFVRFFLLTGKEKAVLIDSGANCPNAADIAKTLTDKPIMLLNTHGDGDHTSGTDGFERIHIHPLDYIHCNIQNRYSHTALVAINDGDVIELGSRPLRIIHIPGHTKGSVAVLDEKNRVLYAGDTVQRNHIYMFGEKRDPESYEESLDKLISMKDKYDCIYSSHGDFLLPAEYVEKVKAVWKRVQSGNMEFDVIDLHGIKVKSYTASDCGFFME